MVTHVLRRVKRHCQYAWDVVRHENHSLPRDPRTGFVSRLKTQQAMAATHQLTSQGSTLSAESKHSETWKPPTDWRAKDMYQTWCIASHSSHSQTEESGTGIVSRLDTQQVILATHRLKGKKKASLASSNDQGLAGHSPTGQPKINVISRPETKQGMPTTHILKSQGQRL